MMDGLYRPWISSIKGTSLQHPFEAYGLWWDELALRHIY
jgi:hypothetical protein